MKPLAALAAVLVALLGWESLPDAGAPVAMTSVSTPPARATPPQSPLPVAAWTRVVLARPLFAEDRRPRAAAPGMPTRSAAPDALPRLAGTVRSNDTLMAIFTLADRPSARAIAAGPATISPIAVNSIPGIPPQGGSRRDGRTPDASDKSIVVARDGLVAGWTVVDIVDGAATLERDGRSVTLHLSYANQSPAPHVATPEVLVLLHDKRTNPFLQP